MKEAANLAPGLYIVATPIGNLGDITLRALDVLKHVDRIACEDTRQTQKLLNHFAIATPTISCHEHNERHRAAELIAALKSGGSVALVSDAGMPGISDPGTWLVKEAIASGVSVIPIPGANAAVSSLVASGLQTEEFHFIGFLPEKSGARRSRLERLAAEPATSASRLDLLFLDPPYAEAAQYSAVLSFLGSANLLAPNAVVIAEHLRKLDLPESFGKLERVRVLRQGDAALSFYRYRPPSPPEESRSE